MLPTRGSNHPLLQNKVMSGSSSSSSSSVAIDRPSKILKYLYLGSKVHAKSKSLLLELKVTHVLNCTPKRSVDPENGCPNYFEKERTFTYRRIPVFDNRGEDILGHMEAAFKFIEEGKHYGNVLVHCHKGISRSASFVLGYLMKKNEMTLDEALGHVQSCRPIVQPNESFMSQLKQYDSQLSLRRSQEVEAWDSHVQNSGSSAIHKGATTIGPCMPSRPEAKIESPHANAKDSANSEPSCTNVDGGNGDASKRNGAPPSHDTFDDDIPTSAPLKKAKL